ncbi:MAG: DUF1707 SHOCT-like domain-containing protein [Jatrophihabitans sp.]
MTDDEGAATQSSQDAIRIGKVERDAALQALDDHMSAGRIDAEEYGERSAKIYVARTWGEITPLFTDLPEPRPGPTAPAPRSLSTMVPAQVSSAEVARPDHGGALGGRVGATVVAVSPFIALALFLITQQWWWFLLIPAAGAVVYGGLGHNDHHGRDRQRNR